MAESFGAWVRHHLDARDDLPGKVKRLAAETGIKTKALYRYLGGRSMPTAKVARRMAEALGVDAGELMARSMSSARDPRLELVLSTFRGRQRIRRAADFATLAAKGLLSEHLIGSAA